MASGASRRHCPPRIQQRPDAAVWSPSALQCEKSARRPRRICGKSSMAWLWPVRTAEPCSASTVQICILFGVHPEWTNKPGRLRSWLKDDVYDLELSYRECAGPSRPCTGDRI